MSPGIEALAAVLGCQTAAFAIAAVMAACGKLRITVSAGHRQRGPKAGERM